jgi:hypothetical protein
MMVRRSFEGPCAALPKGDRAGCAQVERRRGAYPAAAAWRRCPLGLGLPWSVRGRASQIPVSAASFGAPAKNAAWHNKPSYAIVATTDGILSTELQRFMAKRAGSA